MSLGNSFTGACHSSGRQTKLIFSHLMLVFGLCAVPQLAFTAEDSEPDYGFSDRYMLRVGAFFVDSTNTQFSINSTTGLGAGTTLDFNKDLGGEKRDTIPRIDAYYRFNDYHRIDFTTFSVDRAGKRTLKGEVVIGDEVYPVGKSLNSNIKYTLYKLGYSYSFYRSPKVELSFSAGLNIAKYDLNFSNDNGSNAQSTGVTAPLPVFGLRMGYLMTPKWSVQYVMEIFALKIEDKFRGSLVNFELNTEYRLFENFALGLGIANLGLNADVTSDEWRGSVTDNYAGYTAFATLYF